MRNSSRPFIILTFRTRCIFWRGGIVIPPMGSKENKKPILKTYYRRRRKDDQGGSNEEKYNICVQCIVFRIRQDDLL